MAQVRNVSGIRLIDAHALKIASALLVIYVVWGSTYLAIRVMVDDAGGNVPPLLATGSRFAIATLLLVLWVAIRRGVGVLHVPREELRAAATIGVVLLVGGTGLVNVAEQRVPSGLTAVVVGSVPLTVILLRRLFGERVGLTSVASVLVGFAALAALLLPGTRLEGVPLGGMVIVLVASALWSVGSFWSSRTSLPSDPLVSITLQMLAGTVASIVLGAALGEFSALGEARIGVGVVSALLYLSLFGSVLAFSAYAWLLQNAPVSTVATYAYVNPVVALALGWLILGERVTFQVLAVSSVIVASVAFTVWREGRIQQRATAAAAGAAAAAALPDRRASRKEQSR